MSCDNTCKIGLGLAPAGAVGKAALTRPLTGYGNIDGQRSNAQRLLTFGTGALGPAGTDTAEFTAPFRWTVCDGSGRGGCAEGFLVAWAASGTALSLALVTLQWRVQPLDGQGNDLGSAIEVGPSNLTMQVLDCGDRNRQSAGCIKLPVPVGMDGAPLVIGSAGFGRLELVITNGNAGAETITIDGTACIRPASEAEADSKPEGIIAV